MSTQTSKNELPKKSWADTVRVEDPPQAAPSKLELTFVEPRMDQGRKVVAPPLEVVEKGAGI